MNTDGTHTRIHRLEDTTSVLQGQPRSMMVEGGTKLSCFLRLKSMRLKTLMRAVLVFLSLFDQYFLDCGNSKALRSFKANIMEQNEAVYLYLLPIKDECGSKKKNTQKERLVTSKQYIFIRFVNKTRIKTKQHNQWNIC